VEGEDTDEIGGGILGYLFTKKKFIDGGEVDVFLF
jgi:hypothetical protein